MSDDEDDYLSAKFLEPTPSSSRPSSSSAPKTYSQIRREAQRTAEAKNAQNRIKSRREREVEARDAGLSKSLFDRAKEEEEMGILGGTGSKALGMMARMGFKPGQSLGKAVPQPLADAGSSTALDGLGDSKQGLSLPASSKATNLDDVPVEHPPDASSSRSQQKGHLVEPLPLSVWAGRKGLGLGKRAASPTPLFSSHPEKSARLSVGEQETAEAFRARTRLEYEEKRAEGRLVFATRTCVALDEERGGIKFNFLWLNPRNPNSCPPELLVALSRDLDDIDGADPGNLVDDDGTPPSSSISRDTLNEARAQQLRAQMQADALEPLAEDFEDSSAPNNNGEKDRIGTVAKDTLEFTADEVAQARLFLQATAATRLSMVLAYLRSRYSYCFWCGTQYTTPEEMAGECPGEEEEAHD